MRLSHALPAATALLLASCTPSPQVTPVATPVTTPDVPRPATAPRNILLLGDSQISFGAGGPYQRFFANLASACTDATNPPANTRAAVIGVRSSALHNWTATTGPARGVICDVDPKFGVNAGSYGVTSPNLSYVQIGADPAYPFCTAGKSALEAVFDAPAYDPDLVVLSFLGNAAERWQSRSTAQADWAATQALIPADTACIVMTTIPAFDTTDNRARLTAQTNLATAVRAGKRCAFVAGLTPATLAEFEGNPRHFRTREDGSVRDPRHPTAASAARFVQLQTPALCNALAGPELQ